MPAPQIAFSGFDNRAVPWLNNIRYSGLAIDGKIERALLTEYDVCGRAVLWRRLANVANLWRKS